MGSRRAEPSQADSTRPGGAGRGEADWRTRGWPRMPAASGGEGPAVGVQNGEKVAEG